MIVKVGRLLIINLYLPCHSTKDRMLICNDVMDEVLSWRCTVIIPIVAVSSVVI